MKFIQMLLGLHDKADERLEALAKEEEVRQALILAALNANACQKTSTWVQNADAYLLPAKEIA